MKAAPWRSVVALSGGVGGARLLSGLARELGGPRLTAIVNTADDFEHWGLPICPDLDTVMYTLAGRADAVRGWGLRDETFACLEAMKEYGAPSWFQLGDRDLATHLFRAQRLAAGVPLSAVVRELCAALNVTVRLLPMTDDACRTVVETETHGTLPFQQWLVRHRAAPPVIAIRFEGRPDPAPGVLDALAGADLIVITPSNPYVSIDPILSLPGVRDVLGERTVVGVSPIVGQRAVKGPLAAMIPALAHRPPSAAAVAMHYEDFLDGFVVHDGDDRDMPDVRLETTDIVMHTEAHRARLAARVLAFAREIPRQSKHAGRC